MSANRQRLLFTFLLAAACGVCAQDYPNKSITVVVPFAAGGPTDTLARNLGVTLTNTLKQQVVVDNSGGAGGTIGINKVAKAKPDGYTLLLMHIGMATAPALYRKLPYDTMNDFEFIGQVADVPMTMLGKKTLPPSGLKELLPYIKANKDKLNYGNAGVGAASHLCGLLFMSQIEADLNTVSYKGTAPAMVDLMGGQIDLMCDQTTNTTSQIEAKKVKVYGVTTSKQLATPVLKDVPTLAASGLKNFEVTVWHGLYAPKGTPAAVLTKLNNALKVALKDPDFIKKQEGLGAVVVTDKRSDPAEHKKFVVAEIAKWSPIIRAAGVYAD